MFWRKSKTEISGSTDNIEPSLPTCGSCNKPECASGVPERLSLDKILRNETCSPCSVEDLLNYLRFVEHSAEHLEFYLWYLDYSKRFETLSQEEKDKSQPWVPRSPGSPKDKSVLTSTVTSISTIGGLSRDSSMDENDTAYPSKVSDSRIPSLTAQEFSTQPFRMEISRIISRYIAQGAPRELNISARDRDIALSALSLTTHPSAVLHLKATCDSYLRYQSHPNFIKWTVANATKPRKNFAYVVGITCLLLGVFINIIFTLSKRRRMCRLAGAIFWAIGVLVLICAVKGICVVLMAMGHRRLLEPWEIPYEDIEEDKKSVANSSNYEPSKSNSAGWTEEVEPAWLKRDKSRPWIRRVFSESTKIQDRNIRRIQDVIVLQSLGLAFLGTIPFLAVFLSIPPIRLF